MLKDLITDIALIIVFLYTFSLLIGSGFLQGRFPLSKRIQTGLLGGGFGIILLQFTVQVSQNVIMDLRHIVIVMAARMGGLVGAMITSLIIASARLLLFPYSHAAFVSAANVLLTGLLCGLITRLRIPETRKLMGMHFISIALVSLLFTYLTDPLTLPGLLLHFWSISIAAGFLTQSFVDFLINKESIAEQLRQSEQQNRKLLEELPEGLLIHAGGRIRYANQQGAQLLGAREPAELINEALLRFVHPDFKAIVSERARRVIQEGETVDTTELHLIRMDNRAIQVETTGISIQFMGSPASLVIMKDITERKRTEEAIHKANLRTQSILESITDAFMSLDHGWNFTYINNEAEKFLGRSREELLGRSMWKAAPQLIGTELHAIYHQILLGEEAPAPLQEDIRIAEEWYEIRVYPSPDGLSIYLHNITEHKMSELAVAESEARFRLLAENASDMLSKHNIRGVYTYVSPSSQVLFGYLPEEMMGRPVYDFIHPHDLELMEKAHLQMLRSQGMMKSRLRFRLRHQNGSYVWVESAVRSAQDTGQELISVTREVTEIVMAEEELRRVNEELSRFSYLDGLTGVGNRRSFDLAMAQHWESLSRQSRPLSLLLMDIDHFKIYNDTYGHQAGDICLIEVAELITRTLRAVPAEVCRYGGEEFAVILPDVELDAAGLWAEKIRAGVEALKLPSRRSPVSPFVTLSIGAAAGRPDSSVLPGELTAAADQALYRAKRERNSVCSQDMGRPEGG